MDVVELKEKYLFNNEDNIIKILTALGCGNARRVNANEVRSAIDNLPESNSLSLKINIDNCIGNSFSDRFKFAGDIITLVQKKKECSFLNAMKFICSILGVEYTSNSSNTTNAKNKGLFGGYYQDLLTDFTDTITGYNTLPEYDEDVLDQFTKVLSRKFLDDGINLNVQNEFKICYDENSSRIVVPWRNPQGTICGLMGRYNGENYEDLGIAKWMPIYGYNFSKSLTLFGYSENYQHLVNNYIFVGESEKFVLRLRSMEEEFLGDDLNIHYKGIYNALGCGGHTISDTQVALITSLYPKGVIVCFDEDISLEDLTTEAKKLKKGIFNQFPVGFVYDKDNRYLIKDSKMSPSDVKDIKEFKELIANCVVWI